MSLKFGELTGILDLNSKPFDEELGKTDSKFGRFEGVAKKAMLGVGAALVGAGIKGTMAFADFDSSMREVFTLMPGMSQDAMAGMTGDVKSFSKEFKLLPDKVIPALYNAISAGQTDDPFAFLGVSAKLAKAGVSELEPATMALSAAVNAFEKQGLTAEDAADILFTTVKQGVTTIPDLAASLNQVLPGASALGVSMEEVGASIATVTKLTGAPTAQAMTMMKAAMNEALTPSSKLSKQFKEISGKSIPEFIKGGGNLNQALQKVHDSVDGNESAFAELFGSGEALAFALNTVGSSAGVMTENLDAMGNRAGAVDTAFETMNAGVGSSMEGMKVAAQLAFISIGESIAPMVEQFLGLAMVLMDKLGPAFENFGGIAAGAIALLAAVFGVHYAAMAASAVKTAVLHSVEVGKMVAKGVWLAAQSAVHAAAVVASWVATSAGAVAAGVVMAAQVAAQVAGWALLGAKSMLHAGQMAAAWVVAMGPVAWVTAAIVGLVALVIANWDKVKRVTVDTWNAVVGFVKDAGGKIVSAVTEGVGKVVEIYTFLPRKILDALGDLGSLLYNAGKNVIGGFIRGIKNSIPSLTDVLGGITGLIPKIKGPPGKDKVLLKNAGRFVMEGFITGIEDRPCSLQEHLARLQALVSRPAAA